MKKLADPVMDAAQVRLVAASSKSDLADDRDDCYMVVLVINPDLGFFTAAEICI